MEEIISQINDPETLKVCIRDLREVLSVFLDNEDWAERDDTSMSWVCKHCNDSVSSTLEGAKDIKHKLGCPVIRAKAFLGE